MGQPQWTEITSTEGVTAEILEAAEGIRDGWYSEGRIDWENFFDRLENTLLDDGTRPDFGSDMQSPAIEKIKAHIRAYRRS